MYCITHDLTVVLNVAVLLTIVNITHTIIQIYKNSLLPSPTHEFILLFVSLLSVAEVLFYYVSLINFDSMTIHAIVRVMMIGYQIQSHDQLAVDDNSFSRCFITGTYKWCFLISNNDYTVKQLDYT